MNLGYVYCINGAVYLWSSCFTHFFFFQFICSVKYLHFKFFNCLFQRFAGITFKLLSFKAHVFEFLENNKKICIFHVNSLNEHLTKKKIFLIKICLLYIFLLEINSISFVWCFGSVVCSSQSNFFLFFNEKITWFAR